MPNRGRLRVDERPGSREKENGSFVGGERRMKTSKHSRGTYIKHALAHPWHVVVLAVAIVFGVANWSLWVLLAVFFSFEAIVLGIVLNLQVFRDYVDERLLSIDRAKAAKYRAQLLNQISDEHRRELLRLESRIDCMEARFEQYPAIGSYVALECKELLGTYIKLGLQYQLLTHQDMVDIGGLNNQLEIFKKIQAVKPDSINEHRISIAEKRLNVLHDSVAARQNLLNQIEAIAETIYLKTEQAILPSENVLKLRVDDSAEEAQEIRLIDDVDMEQMNLGRAR